MNGKIISLVAILIFITAAILPTPGQAKTDHAPQADLTTMTATETASSQANCGLLTNLVSYWKLDEVSGDAMDWVGGNTLTANHAPGSAAGIVNGARTFDGNAQFFRTATNPSVETGATDFSFTAWVNMSSKSGYRAFISKQTEDDPTHVRDYSLYYDVGFDRFIFQVAGPDGYTLTRAMANSLGSPATTTWYFLAGGYDYADGEVWISVDGGPKETVPFAGPVHVGSAPFEIGGIDNPMFGYQQGLMDEVGFWKRMLTDAEISILYNDGQGTSYDFGADGTCPNEAPTATPTFTSTATLTPSGPTATPTSTSTPGGICPLTTNLISYWKLDEASGDAIDATGTNTLEDYNAPGAADGILNGARTFSGDHQFFSIATNPSVETGAIDFSFTAWVNMSDKSANRAVIGKQTEDHPVHNRDYSLYYDSSFDRFIFQVAGPDGYALTRAFADSLGNPATNTWYFLAGGYDYDHAEVWISVNGGPKETEPFTGAVHVGPAPFMLGSVYNPLFGFHAGLLDEVGFWKRTLSSDELSSLYNGGSGLAYPFKLSTDCTPAKPEAGHWTNYFVYLPDIARP